MSIINLLMIAFMQLVFRYLFLAQSYVDLALTDFNYILLVRFRANNVSNF